MDGITLSFTDARPVLAPGALEEQVRAAAPLLAEAAAGEERYRDNLGWHSVDEAAGPERVDFLLEQAARVRADADAFVVIGIGGSNQASRAAVKALRPEGGPAILWAGNTISACEMARTLRELDGYQSIYIDCIAKNFETLEPGIAFRVLRQYLERRYGAEGAAKAHLRHRHAGLHPPPALPRPGLYVPHLPETIGGRYSVGSDVGALPHGGGRGGHPRAGAGDAGHAGYPPRRPGGGEPGPALRLPAPTAVGARLPPGDALLFRTPAGLLRQVVDSALRRERGQGGHRPLPGGGLQLGGSPLHRPVHPGGQSHPFETFVEVRARDASVLLPPEAKKDYFDYLTGKDFWDINNTARQATMRAHSDRGIPCMNLSIPAIDAHTLGGLFYFFLFACYLSCKLLGVNPFNQPGVEGYKGYMFQNLGKPGVN